MFAVLGLGIQSYPILYNCEVVKDRVEALDLAVKLCLEQGAPDDAKAIREDLEENGFYVPTKYGDWSVYVNEV